MSTATIPSITAETVTTDRFLERRTIREDTLDLVRSFVPKGAPPTYRELSRMGGEAIAYHGMRGYWLVRYLEKLHPGFLRRMFSFHRDPKVIEQEMIVELGMEPGRFWSEIDDVMIDHFEKRLR